MKVRPIIFQPEMVRALLAGRKTQTRRLRWAKECAKCSGWGSVGMGGRGGTCPKCHGDGRFLTPLARVEVGDVLYVRESLDSDKSGWFYKADLEPIAFEEGDPRIPGMIAWAHHREHDYAPSIHMPRILSRLTLAVTEVRFEPVQNISERDAVAEGLINKTDASFPIWTAGEGFGEHFEFPVGAYQELWESISGKESWAANPEVVALTFTVHRQNVDDYLRAEAERQRMASYRCQQCCDTGAIKMPMGSTEGALMRDGYSYVDCPAPHHKRAGAANG